MSPENQRWFSERLETPFIVEHTVEASLEEKLKLVSLLKQLKWDKLLSLKGHFYPMLVREFYANIEFKEKMHPTQLVSTVRGKRITISDSHIAKFLGLPRGDRLRKVVLKRAPVDDGEWNASESRRRYGLSMVDNRCYAKELRGDLRVLLHIIGRNILPRASGTNEVRVCDLYLLDLIHQHIVGKDINMGYLLLQEMSEVVRYTSTAKNLVFPILISRLLEKKGVVGDNEVVTTTSIGERFTEETFLHMNTFSWMIIGCTIPS